MRANGRSGWAALVLLCAPLAAPASDEEITLEATQVMREIMAIPARGIPESLLRQAQGLAIVPGMVKGGFVVGIKHGRGVVLVRDEAGHWRSPIFITATGGSVGWQVGLQSTDVILVFRNRRGVDGLMRGKFTIGADAAVAAGPIGREAAAATDGQLKAEILSYSRSRGLFAGVAIDGAVIQPDHQATEAFYGRHPGHLPMAAARLMETVASYTGGVPRAPVVVRQPPVPVPPAPLDEREALRSQLARSSQRLQTIVDNEWKQYLALPQETYTQGKVAPAGVMEACLERYNAIAANRDYQSLTSRPEFQETHMLLTRHCHTLQPPGSVLKLPPPPR